jgi:hypothetical protein
VRELRTAYRLGNWVELIVGTLVAATVLRALVAVGEGRTPTIGGALGEGAKAWGLAVKTTFVTSILAGLATLLFVVPGLFVATRYMLAVPASVIDGLDTGDARKKSWDLVKDRGTGRMFLWAVAAIFSWYMLVFVVQVVAGVALPTLPPLAEAVKLAVLSVGAHVVGAGLVIAAGILYLELVGGHEQLLWPVGQSLRTAGGQRVAGPRSSGQLGLIAVGAAAGLAALLALPIVAVGAWVLIDEEGFEDFVDEHPALGDAFAAIFGEQGSGLGVELIEHDHDDDSTIVAPAGFEELIRQLEAQQAAQGGAAHGATDNAADGPAPENAAP